MTVPLGAIYTEHHREGHRLGNSILKDARGEFLREVIGTGKHVLDIGCRDGVLTETYYRGNTVLGVDIDTDALEDAKRRLGIEVRSFDLTTDWPLANESFDVVVAGEVLEHLYFPEKVVTRVAAVLTTPGIFVGSVPNAFSLKNRIRLFLGRKKNTPLNDPTHINHFTHSELKELLERHFCEVQLVPLGRFTLLDRLFPGMFSFMLLFKASGVKKDV